MITMTSLDAQNQFGTLIDTSQRQPVTVTRRGRPVAVVLSYQDYVQRSKTIPAGVAKYISENFALRGPEAQAALQKLFDSASNRAAEEGLTEDELMRMLDDAAANDG